MDFKLFDSLLEPVFVIDENRKIKYCNEAAAFLSGVSVRRVVRTDKPINEAFMFTDSVHCFENLNLLSDPSPYQEVSFKNLAGEEKKAQITTQPFLNNLYLVYFRDVTLEERLQKKYRSELEQKENVISDLKKAKNELENYSKNLETMVEDRTFEIKKLNQLMTALLDSLNQGFFIFNFSGDCLEVYSKACLKLLGAPPAGQKIWDVLKLKSSEVAGFKKWMTTAFAEMLPFDDLAPLAPQTLNHPEDLSIKLEYYPIRAENKNIEAVVVVATDITDLVLAQIEAQRERSHAKMIVSMIEHSRELKTFIKEAEDLIAGLRQGLGKTPIDFNEIFRILHTLKGGASSFSIKALAEICHEAESKISAAKEDKMGLALLKALSLQIGPIFDGFIQENQAIIGDRSKWAQRWIEIPASQLLDFADTHLKPEQRSTLFETFLYEPAGVYFGNFNEVIKNVADLELKKVAPIKITGAELNLFPEPYIQLFSTLVHAFRNSVDHGIEAPEQRLLLGKPEQGQIAVKIIKSEEPKEKPSLIITIEDDGAGIDPLKIRNKLNEKGIPHQHLTDQEVIQSIFAPEFSTRDGVSMTSGRGVGMDAIKNAALNLGGDVWVKSEVNRGTILTIQVPWIEATQKKLKVA